MQVCTNGGACSTTTPCAAHDSLYDLSKRDWTFKGYCLGCCCRKKARRLISDRNQALRKAKAAEQEERNAVRITCNPPPRLASRPACGRGAATCASTDSACLAWDRALQRSTLRDRGSRRVNSGTATPKANTAAARLAKAEKNFKHTDSKKQTIHTEDPQPVTDVANTGDKTYLGTWINEAVVVHKNGRLIRRYMKLKGRQVYSGARMRWLRCGAAVARSTHTRASWCRRHDRLQS